MPPTVLLTNWKLRESTADLQLNEIVKMTHYIYVLPLQTLTNACCGPITVVWDLCVRTQWAPSCVIQNTSASAASHRMLMATVLVRHCQDSSLLIETHNT